MTFKVSMNGGNSCESKLNEIPEKKRRNEKGCKVLMPFPEATEGSVAKEAAFIGAVQQRL